MKKIIFFGFLILSTFCFSQKKEMMEAIKNRQPDKALEIGNKLLETDPNSFETNFLFAKAYNEKNDFNNALIFIDKANKLTKENWQKSWILVEGIQTFFGLGKIDEAKHNYQNAKNIEGTKNSQNELKYWGILLGFDEIYNDWKVVETKNLTFHFQNGISEEEIKNITSTRQNAFEQINSFFNSNLPKKIDFFVWNQQGNFNSYLNKNLGFTKPEFCISHNRMNQSAGHEIAHNISYWRNAKNQRTRFINEGIGVYFDQNKNDKLKLAKEAYQLSPISIKKMWQEGNEVDEILLYPISGAFVEYLAKVDKDKFLQLSENQTYENAKKIYNGKIDKLIEEFTKTLKNNSR